MTTDDSGPVVDVVCADGHSDRQAFLIRLHRDADGNWEPAEVTRPTVAVEVAPGHRARIYRDQAARGYPEQVKHAPREPMTFSERVIGSGAAADDIYLSDGGEVVNFEAKPGDRKTMLQCPLCGPPPFQRHNTALWSALDKLAAAGVTEVQLAHLRRIVGG